MKGMKNVLKQFGKAVCYYLLFLGMQFMVGFAMMFCFVFMETAKMMAVGNYDMETIATAASQALLQNSNLMTAISGIFTLLVLWIFFLIRKKKMTVEAGVTPLPKASIAYMVLLGIVLAITVSFGLSLLPESWLAAYAEQANMMVGGPVLLTVFSTMIVAPVVEEVIFRGLMLSRLRKAMPAGWAIAVVSLLFGLAHGQILWIAYAFILGIILSLVVLKTESLAASICLHMTFNIFGTVVPALSEGITSTAVYVIITVLGCAASVYLLLHFMKKQHHS